MLSTGIETGNGVVDFILTETTFKLRKQNQVHVFDRSVNPSGSFVGYFF